MSKVQWLGDVTRWKHNFTAYFAGKQIYKAWDAYLSAEEGHAQAKSIWTSLAKTNAYGYLTVCDEQPGKNLVECWDGKVFSVQVTTTNKGSVTCGPGQVAYQHADGSWGCKAVVTPGYPLTPFRSPKPTSTFPVTAIVPGFPRPPRVNVQWVGGDVRTHSSRPNAPLCPPGYHFSSRLTSCVPGPGPKGVIHGALGALVTNTADVAEAKQDLAVWGEKNPKLSPASGYKGEGAEWNATDASMLMAFATWWNANYAFKLETTGVLDSYHLFSLRSYVLTPTQKAPGGGGNVSPGGGGNVSPGGGGNVSPPVECPPDKILVNGICVTPLLCPPGQVLVNGKCVLAGGCDDKTPCPAGQTCVSGKCQTLTMVTPPKVEEKKTPWGWIIGGAALAGLAGWAIWSGARGVGGAMGAPGVRSNPATRKYLVRFVHNIAPKDTDVMGPVDIPDGAFSNRSTLAKALRDARVLPSGGRVRDFRVEGDKVVVFPVRSIWWSIILSSWAPAGGVREALGLDSVDRVHSSPAPSENIYWKDIKPEDRVELRGHVYVVTKPSGKKLTAYWMSHGGENREAQRWLDWASKGRVKARGNPAPIAITKHAVDKLGSRLGFEWLKATSPEWLAYARKHPISVSVRVRPGANEGRIVEVLVKPHERDLTPYQRKEFPPNITVLQGKTFGSRQEAWEQAGAVVRSLISGHSRYENPVGSR